MSCYTVKSFIKHSDVSPDQSLADCWPSSPHPPVLWFLPAHFLSELLKNWGILQKLEAEAVPVGVCMFWYAAGTFISACRHLNTPKTLPLKRNGTPTYSIWNRTGTPSLVKLSIFVVYNSTLIYAWPIATVRISSVTNCSKVQPFNGIVVILPVPSASPASTEEYHQNSSHFFSSLHRPAW